MARGDRDPCWRAWLEHEEDLGRLGADPIRCAFRCALELNVPLTGVVARLRDGW